MTEYEWRKAETRDPAKAYVDPAIAPSYKRSMRLGGACFLADSDRGHSACWPRQSLRPPGRAAQASRRRRPAPRLQVTAASAIVDAAAASSGATV